MRKSEYNPGDILVSKNGSVFIHDGLVNGDGHGVICSLDTRGILLYSSEPGNMQTDVYRCATEQEKRILLDAMRGNYKQHCYVYGMDNEESIMRNHKWDTARFARWLKEARTDELGNVEKFEYNREENPYIAEMFPDDED